MGVREWYRRQVVREGGTPRPQRAVATGASPTGTRAHSSQLRETVPNPTTEDWFWGRASATGSEEDYFWRRLSDNWTMKDVLPGTFLEIHNQVYEAYNANPMANAIVEMGVNFVLGDGLHVEAPHPKVQRLLDAFWHDPDNRMDIRQYELATELSLYGELFVRFFVNPYSGHVKIGLLDPSLVDMIETDPNNIEKQLRVHQRPIAMSATAPTPPSTPAPVADPDFIKGIWYEVPDEIVHFAINKVSNAKRGKSDLATLLPWLRRYKDWLIDRVRINKYKAAFLWDVTLAGAGRKEIENKMMEYAIPPEPGSLLIHNESEQWKAVQPQINAGNAAPDGQAIKLMIAMGAGIPEHWLSEGGDVNRATAAEMSLPTLKKFQRRQDYLKYLLRTILDRVVAEAQKAGTLPRTIDTSYEIRFPELDVEDVKGIGMAAFNLSQALVTARELGLVSQETAAKMFYDICRFPTDWAEEKEKMASEPSAVGARFIGPHPSAFSSSAARLVPSGDGSGRMIATPTTRPIAGTETA